MADFEVMGGKFTIKANDGHFSEVYEIEAPSMADAMAQAKGRWSERKGMRNAPTHEAAMAAAHAEEMDAAMRETPAGMSEGDDLQAQADRHAKEENAAAAARMAAERDRLMSASKPAPAVSE